MKKFIFILLCFLTFNCYSQTEYNICSAGCNTSCEYYVKGQYVEGNFTAYIQHRLLFYNDMYWRFSYNLVMLKFPSNAPDIRFGVGIESPIISNLYAFGEVFPSIGIVGIGHQVYGDYMAFYLPLNAGIEYRFDLTKGHILSLELSVEKDFTVYNSIPSQLRDDICLRFKLNYSYNFFVDKR